MSGFRRTAIHVALLALLLRAMLPVGWMPNSQGMSGAPFVICTMDGAVLADTGKAQDQHKPSPSDSRSHQPCAFAAAAQLASTPEAAALAAPALLALAPAQDAASSHPARPGFYALPAPRGPPSLT